MLLIYNHFMLNVFRKSNTYNTRKKILNRIIFHNDKLFFQTSVRHNNDSNKSKKNKDNENNENNKNSSGTSPSRKMNNSNKLSRFSFIELENKPFDSSNLIRNHNDETEAKTNLKKRDSNEFKQKNKDDKKLLINKTEIKKKQDENNTDTSSALDILASLINKLDKDEEVDNLLKPIKSTNNRESIKKENDNSKKTELKDQNSIKLSKNTTIKQVKHVDKIETVMIKKQETESSKLNKLDLKSKELKQKQKQLNYDNKLVKKR